MAETQSIRTENRQSWSSRIAFLLATIGFSVGLGNIWRFPYLAGESGGGAFVLIYLAFVLLIGIPIVMAELAIGRRGARSPVSTMAGLARQNGASGAWGLAGGLAMVTAFLITSYYSVIGGWTLHYAWLSASGALNEIDQLSSQALFDDLLADPLLVGCWNFVFIALIVVIVARGLHAGIERAVTVLMPLLFFALVSLAIFGLAKGEGWQALEFLFAPDFSVVTLGTVLAAMGQAFFSVGVGMAAMMTYGSYLPRGISIPKTSVIIALADTFVALVAGLAIFPFVFAYGLAPSEGPGLVFVALPTALSGIGGGLVALAFFVLLSVAALTSAIALFEVLAAWGDEQGWRRVKTALVAGVACFLVGLATVFSFNIASDFHPMAYIPGFENATMFGAIDRLTTSFGLPIAGLLIAVFAGWVLTKADIADELDLSPDDKVFKMWRSTVRYLLPLVISALIYSGASG